MPFPTRPFAKALRRGFTLVELLVVIAIISLIVALIAISIPQVQRQSRSVQCLSNQRQLNVGFTQYYGDNSGRFMGVDTGLTQWEPPILRYQSDEDESLFYYYDPVSRETSWTEPKGIHGWQARCSSDVTAT